MSNWRTIALPGPDGVMSDEQFAAMIAAIAHAITTRPGATLPPLGQDREFEEWVAEYARFAVSRLRDPFCAVV